MGVEVANDIWRVTGGARHGGIIVRADKYNTSPPDPLRLSTGALIEALEYDESSSRLRYSLLTGAGPLAGWVAITAQGRELLVKAAPEQPEAQKKVRPATPTRQPLGRRMAAAQSGQCREEALLQYSMQLAQQRASSGNPPVDTSQEGRTCAQRRVATGAQAPSCVEAALRQGRRSFDVMPRRVGDMGVIAFGTRRHSGQGHARQALRGEAGPVQKQGEAATNTDDHKLEQEEAVCLLCLLPFGDVGYMTEDQQGAHGVHAECAAQLALQDSRDADQARRDREATQKRKYRAQYRIGWKAARIPRNAALTDEWSVPRATCCLVLSEAGRSVSLAPTADPTRAVNLEYLALALKVRRLEGCEPLFSLDPKAGQAGPLDHAEAHWQVKRFEPAWLATTSVGEVMFQADVYLKELSMGEHPQPAVGMMSCLDMSIQDAPEESWNAREWFVVRKAALRLTEGNVLTPYVEMGVEAREQVKGAEGLEDAPLTRPDHPMVKYARAFTRFFDIIAERRSVIYHLRELAKASVLAKFLIDADISVEETLLKMADGVQTGQEAGQEAECIAAIPRLWNKRCSAHICLQDGGFVSLDAGLRVSSHGVYGGVEFGLDRFEIGAQAVSVSGVSTRVAPLSTARYVDQPHLVPFKGTGRAAARGVDLNLDGFDLTEVVQTGPPEGGSWGSGRGSAEPCATIGAAFWKHLKGGPASVFCEQDVKLLRRLFNPNLSDRREEGDMFIPPDASREHVERLSRLIEAEEAIQHQRRAQFLSPDFNTDKPGPLFPPSWAASFTLAKALECREVSQKDWLLQPRPEYMAEVQRFKHVLEARVPGLDKRTEDGTRFRVYDVGSLQVRTIQEHDGEEAIGAFFSSQASSQAFTGEDYRRVSNSERVVRVTQYVETTEARPERCRNAPQMSKPTCSQLHHYVVLETEGGKRIVTEKRGSQAASWSEGTLALEARNSLARVLRSVDTGGGGLSVRDLRGHNERIGSRCYAEDIYSFALAAWAERWAKLSPPQREALQALGVNSMYDWFHGKAEAFAIPWGHLTQLQRDAASSLGLDEGSWAVVVAWGSDKKQQPSSGEWRRSGLAPHGPILV